VLDSLAAFLGAKQALLLLDNCEHLLGACAALAMPCCVYVLA
jgi:predicted ATPase